MYLFCWICCVFGVRDCSLLPKKGTAELFVGKELAGGLVYQRAAMYLFLLGLVHWLWFLVRDYSPLSKKLQRRAWVENNLPAVDCLS